MDLNSDDETVYIIYSMDIMPPKSRKILYKKFEDALTEIYTIIKKYDEIRLSVKDNFFYWYLPNRQKGIFLIYANINQKDWNSIWIIWGLDSTDPTEFLFSDFTNLNQKLQKLSNYEIYQKGFHFKWKNQEHFILNNIYDNFPLHIFKINTSKKT